MKTKGRKLNWKQACEILGCGKTKFYDLIAQESLVAFKVGKRGLFVYEADVLSLIQSVGLESEEKTNAK